MDKVVITVAPCIPPYLAGDLGELDLSPEGVAEEVVRASEAGACVAHLHVWDEQGQPTQDLSAFRRTLELIRERCDIIIEGSTGGINSLSPAERSVSLQCDVELASLNPGSINYDDGVYVNSPDDIAYWAQEMKRRGIKPDAAIFDAAMITNTLELVEQGWVDEPVLFGFVLGQKGGLPATPRNLLFLAEAVPPDSPWGVVAHGGCDLQMAYLSLAMGGHVRAGFEDSVYYRPGQMAESNAQLIGRLARLARELGREPASPCEAREMLGLRPR